MTQTRPPVTLLFPHTHTLAIINSLVRHCSGVQKQKLLLARLAPPLLPSLSLSLMSPSRNVLASQVHRRRSRATLFSPTTHSHSHSHSTTRCFLSPISHSLSLACILFVCLLALAPRQTVVTSRRAGHSHAVISSTLKTVLATLFWNAAHPISSCLVRICFSLPPPCGTTNQKPLD